MFVPDPSSSLHAAHLFLAASTSGPVSLDPSAGNLPGSSQLQSIANGIGGWALVLSLIGLLIGAAAWALGSHAQNYQHAYVGRKAVLVSGLAALLIGAAQPIINFFFSTGQSIKS
jgi:hypothetical protein